MPTTPEQIALWDKINSDPEYFPYGPEPWLTAKLADDKPNLRNAIDLGCGHGRNLVWLAQQGWRVTGLDWSPNALRFARSRVAGKQLVGEFIKEDFRKAHLVEGQFQLAIATRALNHLVLADFQRTLHSIKQIMRIGGKLYFNVPSDRNAPRDVVMGRWIEDQTLVLETGREAYIPHHFYSKKELANEAIQWRSADIETVVEPMPESIAPLHEDHINEWYWVTLTR